MWDICAAVIGILSQMGRIVVLTTQRGWVRSTNMVISVRQNNGARLHELARAVKKRERYPKGVVFSKSLKVKHN